MAAASSYFSEEQQLLLKNAIARNEKKTSGEIRVYIDSVINGDVLERAAEIFETLRMHETHLHNGVLIYVAIESRQFAIIGDSGIHQHVSQNFWEKVKSEMIPFFKRKDFTGGLLHAIDETGAKLKLHFPIKKDDINELPNDVIFGE
ncbi:MAG: TPM domain-containing protein [Bacteroidetes bacterium]|jgi:uncharacterized membrane protein|nr:TPM domain-containing protein [Bacteroidota bacterium]